MNEVRKILIVDDDPECITLVSGILKRAGYEVFTESHVGAAVEIADTQQFDAMILDLRFDNSHVNMTSVIHEFVNRATIGVIILSAFGDPENEKDARLLGAKAYLAKPVDESTLLRTIEMLGKPT